MTKLTFPLVILVVLAAGVVSETSISIKDLITSSKASRIAIDTLDDGFGTSVSSAGDVNGDGIDDIIVGAYRAAPFGRAHAGAAYVIYGKEGGVAPNLDIKHTLDISQGFQISGGAGDTVGVSVSSAGDVNGDGIDDIIVGAPSSAPYGSGSIGAAYVIYGKAGGIPAHIDLSAGLQKSQGFKITGVTPGDNLGAAVSCVGDVNGDGVNDIIVGAFSATPSGRYNAGSAYVIYGKKGGIPSDINLAKGLDLSQGFQISGAGPYDNLGKLVSYGGDMNGDGIDDIIVVAPMASPHGHDYAGSIYVIYGKQGGIPAHIDLKSELDLSQGFQICGSLFYHIGSSVSSARDVNGDGVDDIIFGLPLASPGARTSAGSAMVVYGKAGGLSAHIDLNSDLELSQGFVINGGPVGAYLGTTVSFAGDVNKDGVDDILLASPWASPNGLMNSGAAYIIYGKAGGIPAHIDLHTNLNETQGFIISSDAYDKLGWSVSVGDFDKDGSSDIIFGAVGNTDNGHMDGGSVYIYYPNRVSTHLPPPEGSPSNGLPSMVIVAIVLCVLGLITGMIMAGKKFFSNKNEKRHFAKRNAAYLPEEADRL